MMENTFLNENEVGMWQWLFGRIGTSIVLYNDGPNYGFIGIDAPTLARIFLVCAFIATTLLNNASVGYCVVVNMIMLN